MAKSRTATKERGTRPTARAARPGADPLDARLAAAQRHVVTAVVVLAAVAVWRPLPDPFMLPKITVVLLGALAVLALAGVRAVRAGHASVPRSPAAGLAAALMLMLVVATATADNPVLSLVGQHSRYGGLLSYLGYVVLFLACLRLYTASTAPGIARALLIGLGLVTAYGLVQVLGWDPYSWSSGRDAPVFSTLGNTNFAAAYVAITSPVAAAVALSPARSRNARGAAGVLLAAGLVYILATQASQGVLAVGAGLFVVALASWLRRRRAGSGRTARPAPPRPAQVGALVVALAAVVAAALFVGPDLLRSGGERVQFWQAALASTADHPALGTGLDSFRDYFTRYRPGEHAAARGFQSTDSPHNLPLTMLAGGGLLLALAYVAFVGYTAWMLVRGLRTLQADRLLLLGGFGGMWAAYQVQSMVSLDVPALTLLHYLSAALVLVLVASPPALRVPLSLGAAAPRGRLVPARGPQRATAAALLSVVAVATVAGAWWGTRPLRADLAAAQARGVKAAAALPALDRAVALAPWEAEYRLPQAQARLESRDAQGAYESASRAAELRRGSSKLALGAADLAAKLGRDDDARDWLAAALGRDPRNPAVFTQAAALSREHGGLGQDPDALAERAAQLEREYGS